MTEDWRNDQGLWGENTPISSDEILDEDTSEDLSETFLKTSFGDPDYPNPDTPPVPSETAEIPAMDPEIEDILNDTRQKISILQVIKNFKPEMYGALTYLGVNALVPFGGVIAGVPLGLAVWNYQKAKKRAEEAGDDSVMGIRKLTNTLVYSAIGAVIPGTDWIWGGAGGAILSTGIQETKHHLGSAKHEKNMQIVNVQKSFPKAIKHFTSDSGRTVIQILDESFPMPDGIEENEEIEIVWSHILQQAEGQGVSSPHLEKKLQEIEKKCKKLERWWTTIPQEKQSEIVHPLLQTDEAKDFLWEKLSEEKKRRIIARGPRIDSPDSLAVWKTIASSKGTSDAQKQEAMGELRKILNGGGRTEETREVTEGDFMRNCSDAVALQTFQNNPRLKALFLTGQLENVILEIHDNSDKEGLNKNGFMDILKRYGINMASDAVKNPVGLKNPITWLINLGETFLEEWRDKDSSKGE